MAQERWSAMMALFLLVVLVAVVLGIIGAAAGLGYLLAIGIVLLAVDVIFFAVRLSRHAGRRPAR
ncbi:hypothetical protein [Streptomyces coeruleorubidus]|uniref:DUF2207 domain-containing protein n=1 Tax=Streptomyces coeruleorubidus TaxID=116188 RepID=A0ABZ0KRC6_STRC4|nr:hypothetical protein [Streptomyces coeruleorubidus]WOT40543.1 hypothetical protein R5U08_19460 [Streptomyces coeruleorubidus]